MAHTKAALKDIKTSRKAREANKVVRGRMRTAMRSYLQRTDASGAEEEIRRAMKLVDKAAKKGVIHKNAAARRKSQLDRKLNALKAAAASSK